MKEREEENFFHAIDYLRIGAFLSFLFILGRHVFEYAYDSMILSNFPLFSVGIFTSFPMLSDSLYSNVLEKKRIGSLVYPLLVNLLLWLPVKKYFHSMYGFILVEKWKTQCMMIGSGVILVCLLYTSRCV